jgi:hypothetical protein
MLPDHVLSTIPVIGKYLFPDDLDPSPIVDYELGGVAVSDATQGLKVQVWKVRLKLGVNYIGTVYLSAPNTAEFVVYAGDSISTISLAFDQNMKPALAFMQDEVAKLWWYDNTIPGYDVITLPSDTHIPRICFDDKRNEVVSSADILLTYVRDGSLYFREQRDRFTIEYELKTGIISDVLQFGMTSKNRVQWTFGQFVYPPTYNINRVTTAGRRRITTTGALRKVVGATYG